MNFSGISSSSFFGKCLRLPLGLIPKKTQVRILQGNLRGTKWIVGSGTHGYWLGSYEFEKQALFSKMIKKGNIVYDIGANVGFYSLLASKLVGKTGQVVAFEPVQRNLEYFQKHIEINMISNVTIIDSAITNKEGSILFNSGPNSFMGHVSDDGKEYVKTTSLDHLYVDSRIPLPNVIKIDIEGAEFDALIGAELVINLARPIIFLATHDKVMPNVHYKCIGYLRDKGYKLLSVEASKMISETTEIIAIP